MIIEYIVYYQLSCIVYKLCLYANFMQLYITFIVYIYMYI